MSILIKCGGKYAKYKELEIALKISGDIEGDVFTSFPISGLTRGKKGSKYYEVVPRDSKRMGRPRTAEEETNGD